MRLEEYAGFDALGLAELVARREVTAKELAETAARAIEVANPAVNAVVETYRDRIEGLDEKTLGEGPFRGVPFLMKDVLGHEKGRLCEWGSRLCKGLVTEVDSHLCELFRKSGVNILGRSNAPEFSMSATTENALYGNTSNPWRKGYSAGGSTGGGQAAVTAGMVPMAHGSDIGGSIRIPAGWCGGVGLKPTRGRISAGPSLDEGGFGMTMNFVQVQTVRDAAAMLDCLAVPQAGDPFLVPRPAEPYAAIARKEASPLRIGWSVKPLMDAPVDPEVAAAVKATAKVLADMGHHVEEDDPVYDGVASITSLLDFWFFGFDVRLEAYGERVGRKPGPDTLEPATLALYEHARGLKAAHFFAANAANNRARRSLGAYWGRHDVWLGPTLAQVAEPHGRYNLGLSGLSALEYILVTSRPVQFTVPHNIMGTPAMSLPLAMHSSGLPIGVQIAGPPATEHNLLMLAGALEQAMPWKDRVPPLHVSRLTA
ncbi:MAG: amidase [Hyphomicrobiaceae bacterium]